MQQNIATAPDNSIPRTFPLLSARAVYGWISHTARMAKMLWKSAMLHFRRTMKPDMSAALNIERLSAQLSVEDRARADGRNERPPASEETVTGTQKEVVLHFKELQRRSHRHAASVADSLRVVGDEIDLLEASGNILDIPSRAENEIRRLNAEFRTQVAFLRDREALQHEHYRSFCEKHRLHRVAEHHSTRFLHHTVMAGLIFACAFAIGKLSQQAIQSAMPGSVAPVVLIGLAVVGVVIPFALGNTLFKYVNHVAATRRLIGWLAGAASLAIAGVVAFAVAHYVAVSGADPEATLRTAVDSAVTTPTVFFGIFSAWASFGVMALGGLLSHLVGYNADDKYPGYGAVQRAYYGARAERDLLAKRLRGKMNAIIDNAESEVAEIPRTLKRKIREYSRLIDELRRLPATLAAYDVALEDACNILLERYRTANENARKTKTPISFAEHVCFRLEHEAVASTLSQEEARLEKFNHGIAELEAEAVQARKRLKDLNWRAISALDDTTYEEAQIAEA